jgi:hypothetical protein
VAYSRYTDAKLGGDYSAAAVSGIADHSDFHRDFLNKIT